MPVVPSLKRYDIRGSLGAVACWPSIVFWWFRIICPHHGYPCKKYQSMEKGVRALGRYAAAYLLCGWAERASCFDEAADHVAYNPSHAEVAARKAAHPVGQ